MGRQASREHRLSKDRPYPSVGDVDFPKVTNGVTVSRAEVVSALIVTEEPRVATTSLVASQESVPLRTASVMSLCDINAAIDVRHDNSDEKLTEYIQTNFSGTPASLRDLEPLIKEIKRRFKHLPKKPIARGERKRIAGHATFKSWCAGILNRTVNELNASFDTRVAETKTKSKTLLQEINAALDTRHEDTDEKLTHLIQSNFSGSQSSLRQLRPFLEEIARRFRLLPRGLGIGGEYRKIAGYRTFKDFCEGVLNRTAHRVRQILREAHGQMKKSKKGKEDISAVSERVKKYLQNQVDTFEGSERVEILENIFNAITEMAQDGAA